MGDPHGVVANVLDFDIEVTEFELLLRSYVHLRISILGKGMNPFYLPGYELNTTCTILLLEWIDVLFDKETKAVM